MSEIQEISEQIYNAEHDADEYIFTSEQLLELHANMLFINQPDCFSFVASDYDLSEIKTRIFYGDDVAEIMYHSRWNRAQYRVVTQFYGSNSNWRQVAEYSEYRSLKLTKKIAQIILSKVRIAALQLANRVYDAREKLRREHEESYRRSQGINQILNEFRSKEI